MAGYYGQALMNIGSIIGSNMTRSIQEDERQSDRLELQREREREATERQRERLAAQERQDALYRRTADQQTAAAASRSGGGGGAFSPADLAEGGNAESIVAGRMQMTVPELRKLDKAQLTGDASGYRVDVTRTTSPASAGVDPYNMETIQETVKEYPPGFDKEIRSKFDKLASIRESMRMGKDFKDVTEGRQNEFETRVGEGVLSGEMSMGRGSGAVASMSGKPIVDVKDGTAFNQYTGTSQTTEKGQSEIRENNAQAAKYSADAKKVISEATGALEKGASQEKLATMLSSLNKLAESSDLNDAGRKRVQELQMSIVDAMKTNVDGRSGAADNSRKRTEADEHSDALKAIATKKISVEEANKRLTGAGYKPLPADAGKAGAPKPSPAPEPKAEAAPRQDVQVSPDSKVGKARQAQAEATANKQAWDDEQKSKASTAFAELNLKDRLAASKLQASPLFAYLTREQKTDIYRAVNSR